jgi:MFS transporter, FHS family, L-fucose permease
MIVLTTLFFMWGFMTVMNDVLIPHLRQVFTLTYAQSLLIQSCFFGAYGLGSLAYYLYSMRGGDPILRYGYKRASIGGLLLSACGALLFIPATYVQVYEAYLFALFVLGLGFTVLQIAANPFVSLVGAPEGAGSRLNLAQGFNSLGTTLAPLIGGALIFRFHEGNEAVRWPYLYFGILLLAQALWLLYTHLPEPARDPSTAAGRNALRHPQLRRGMAAIFLYVGAEVAIGSLLINFLGLPGIAGLSHDAAKVYLSLYWGGAMVGRFLGAISLGGRSAPLQRTLLMVLVGLVLTGLLGFIIQLDRAFGIEEMSVYLAFVGLNILLLRVAGPKPHVALGLFAMASMLLVLVAVFHSGTAALWALVGVGIFNSILWSNIFTLSISGLGPDTGQGSSLLVMMIVGGAFLPWLQGALADALALPNDPSSGLQISFLLPAVCYLYLAWFGFFGVRGPTLRT